MRDWLDIALSAPVRARALRMMAVVGAILLTINHGDAILHGDLSRARLFRIALTLCVPYFVSTVSSVAAIRDLRPERPERRRGLQGREEPEAV